VPIWRIYLGYFLSRSISFFAEWIELLAQSFAAPIFIDKFALVLTIAVVSTLRRLCRGSHESHPRICYLPTRAVARESSWASASLTSTVR
jgi:hypothetical protein